MAEENRRREPGNHPEGSSGQEPPGTPVASGRRLPKREGEPSRRGTTFWEALREVLLVLLIAALVAVLIQSFLMKAFVIPSSSMSPTLQIGDRVMVEKVTYYFRKPRTGDIIVFRYPPTAPGATNTTNLLFWPFEQIGETLHLAHRTGSSPYVKRVIASGGQTVEMRKGQVYVDGKELKEDYKVPDSYDMAPTVIPDGQLFVMGDNRPNSRDSRYWGYVPVRSVIGKVFLIWWPPSHFGVPKK